MLDWNVVVSVSPNRYRQAYDLLQEYGPIHKSGFFNVLLMRVDDGLQFLDELYELEAHLPGALEYLTRVVPVTKRRDLTLYPGTAQALSAVEARLKRRWRC